jgi:hypothetical protein
MMTLEKWKTLSEDERKQFWENEETRLEAEKLQVAEMMEQTDEMLVEIHKNLSEKLGAESADEWAEMLKKVRQKEIDKTLNI